MKVLVALLISVYSVSAQENKNNGSQMAAHPQHGYAYGYAPPRHVPEETHYAPVGNYYNGPVDPLPPTRYTLPRAPETGYGYNTGYETFVYGKAVNHPTDVFPFSNMPVAATFDQCVQTCRLQTFCLSHDSTDAAACATFIQQCTDCQMACQSSAVLTDPEKERQQNLTNTKIATTCDNCPLAIATSRCQQSMSTATGDCSQTVDTCVRNVLKPLTTCARIVTQLDANADEATKACVQKTSYLAQWIDQRSGYYVNPSYAYAKASPYVAATTSYQAAPYVAPVTSYAAPAYQGQTAPVKTYNYRAPQYAPTSSYSSYPAANTQMHYAPVANTYSQPQQTVYYSYRG